MSESEIPNIDTLSEYGTKFQRYEWNFPSIKNQ